MSQINFFQIKEEQLGYFEQFDPYDLLFGVRVSECFAIGATVRPPEHQKDIPAGLMVAGESDDRLVVSWLYVAPEYRGLLIGTGLLDLAYAEAAARGIEELAVRVTGDYEDNELGWDPERFLIDMGFTGVEDDLPEWTIPTSVLYGSKDAYKHIEKGLNLIPFSEINNKTKETLYEKMRVNFKNQLKYDLETIEALADPMISYAWVYQKDLMGVVANARSNNFIYPIAFLSKNTNDSLALASNAIGMSEECVNAGDYLKVKCEKLGDEKVMRELSVSSAPTSVKCYTKSVSEYLQQKEDGSWMEM